jgi:hypothetical protein
MGKIINNVVQGKESTTEFDFANIPGMTSGKMFKITEVMSNYLGNSCGNIGQNPGIYMNMISTLYENESKRSSIGEMFRKGISATQTCYNFPLKMASSAVFSSIGGNTPDKYKDALSEVNKFNNYSHLSQVGSDEYRDELMRNDDYMKDFELSSNDS